MGQYFSIIDLQAVQWIGDAKMEGFRLLWDQYLEHLQKTNVLKEEIEYIFLQQVEQSQEMAHNIARYHRVHVSHPHK